MYMSIYIIQVINLCLSFISCITFCIACYFQYKTMVMIRKDKKTNKLQTMINTQVVKELKKKSDEEEDETVVDSTS